MAECDSCGLSYSECNWRYGNCCGLITQLRADLARVTAERDELRDSTGFSIANKIANLRAERDAARARVERMDSVLASACERLSAENDRLRAALAGILEAAEAALRGEVTP